ncbi:hypothetical protein WR25_16456 isoform B [Diploscapter pachys]|uniref:Protein kinase domain-containing protein n=1 Tax=Diploscapter pachys TaxID=2018661 RepID=A0A2A2L153_9BILA|nr:hypothetical protein WR25_16456 isoform B [Diploscapter pachys]
MGRKSRNLVRRVFPNEKVKLAKILMNEMEKHEVPGMKAVFTHRDFPIDPHGNRFFMDWQLSEVHPKLIACARAKTRFHVFHKRTGVKAILRIEQFSCKSPEDCGVFWEYYLLSRVPRYGKITNNMVDSGIVNMETFYPLAFVVTEARLGPTLHDVLTMYVQKPGRTLPATDVARIIYDMFLLVEFAYKSADFVLADIEPKHWVFDVQTRSFVCQDMLDFYHSFTEKKNIIHYKGCSNYAPIRHHELGEHHNMSLLDSFEILLYLAIDFLDQSFFKQNGTSLNEIYKLKLKILTLDDSIQNRFSEPILSYIRVLQKCRDPASLANNPLDGAPQALIREFIREQWFISLRSAIECLEEQPRHDKSKPFGFETDVEGNDLTQDVRMLENRYFQ